MTEFSSEGFGNGSESEAMIRQAGGESTPPKLSDEDVFAAWRQYLDGEITAEKYKEITGENPPEPMTDAEAFAPLGEFAELSEDPEDFSYDPSDVRDPRLSDVRPVGGWGESGIG